MNYYQTSNQVYGSHPKIYSKSEVKGPTNNNELLNSQALKRMSQSKVLSPKHQEILQSLVWQAEMSPMSQQKQQQQSQLQQSKFNNSQVKNAGGYGLANIGQTCYMNCVLQCLFNVGNGKWMNKIEDQLQQTDNFKPAYELLFLLCVTRNICRKQEANYEQMCQVKDIIDLFATHFRGTQQQCAHEFFSQIRELIHVSLNRSQLSKIPTHLQTIPLKNPVQVASLKWDQIYSLENSLVSDQFRGQFLKIMKCTSNRCMNETVLCDVFDDFQLHIPNQERRMSYSNIFGQTQEDQLMDYFKFEFREEKLNEAVCEKCNQRGMDLRTYLIKLPQTFVAQIVRFGQQNQKKHNKVCIPNRLDLSQFIYPTEKYNIKQSAYKLSSIIDHHGETLYKGHYTSSIYNQQDKNWYLYNDDQVTQLDPYFESKLSTQGSQTAYMLFYELI